MTICYPTWSKLLGHQRNCRAVRFVIRSHRLEDTVSYA